jgi:hypothetical protein
MKPQKWRRGYRFTISLNSALDGGGGGGSRPRSGSFTAGKETRYPSHRRLGGPQSRSGWVRKISPLTGNRSTDTPDRSRSLYLLSYPMQLTFLYCSESQYAYLMLDFFLDCLTLQDGTNSLSRSDGNQLRTHAAKHPRKAQASVRFTVSDMILLIYLFLRRCADGHIIASSSFS